MNANVQRTNFNACTNCKVPSLSATFQLPKKFVMNLKNFMQSITNLNDVMRSSPIIAVFISPIGCSLVDVIGHCYCLKIWHSHYCWCGNIVWLFIIVGLRICLVFAFYIIHFHVVLWKCIFMLMCRFRNRPCSFHTLASVTVSVVTAFLTHSRKWNRWGDWWTWGGTNGWRQLWGFFHWFPIVGIFHFNKIGRASCRERV